jgi:hypothetical protein
MTMIERDLPRKATLRKVSGAECVTPAVAGYVLGLGGSVAWGVASILGPWGRQYRPLHTDLAVEVADVVALTEDWNTVVCDFKTTFEKHRDELEHERLFDPEDYGAVGPGNR